VTDAVVEIKVEKRHIDAAMKNYKLGRNWCSACPLATAIIEATGLALEVGLFDVHFGEGVRVRMPPCAVDFRRAADYQGVMEPFSFEIEIPEAVMKETAS
jgi:hypothetical protein